MVPGGGGGGGGAGVVEAAVLCTAAVGAGPALEGEELPDSQPQARAASPNRVSIDPHNRPRGDCTGRVPLALPVLSLD
jgi:hypothetical protein